MPNNGLFDSSNETMCNWPRASAWEDVWSPEGWRYTRTYMMSIYNIKSQTPLVWRTRIRPRPAQSAPLLLVHWEQLNWARIYAKVLGSYYTHGCVGILRRHGQRTIQYDALLSLGVDDSRWAHVGGHLVNWSIRHHVLCSRVVWYFWTWNKHNEHNEEPFEHSLERKMQTVLTVLRTDITSLH